MLNPEQHAAEQEIIGLLQQDPRAGLHLLYDQFAPVLYGLLLRMEPDEQRAALIFGRVWMEVHHALRPGDLAPGQLLPFLMRVTREHAAANRSEKDGLTLNEDLAPLTALLKQGNDHAAGSVCEKMLELVCDKGYTASAIASLTGIAEAQVKQNIRQALKNIRHTS